MKNSIYIHKVYIDRGIGFVDLSGRMGKRIGTRRVSKRMPRNTVLLALFDENIYIYIYIYIYISSSSHP